MIIFLKTPDDVELFWMKMRNVGVNLWKYYDFTRTYGVGGSVLTKRGRTVDSQQKWNIKRKI